MEFLGVDGSHGEGGGQILRMALLFSVVTGRPVRVSKIRAGRKVPGLRRQHVSVLNVLQAIFQGELTGATEGSSEISFLPGRPQLDSLKVDMQTAASITLVLQAVVPAVAISRSRLSIELRGGTDVPWSPTFDYFGTIAKEAYEALGIVFRAEAKRRGYYPRGGGAVTAQIEPCDSLRTVKLIDSPDPEPVEIVSRCAMLPRHVAERQMRAAAESLAEMGVAVGQTLVAEESADSPGSSLLLSATGGGYFLGADSIGARGKPAEAIGRETGERFAATLKSGACVDLNLADMVAPLLCLAKGSSDLQVPGISTHLETCLYVAELFTGGSHTIAANGSNTVVSISPA